MTIASELTTLNSTKQAIKTAIQNKGQDLTGVAFSGYPAKIDAISGGGGGGTYWDDWSQEYYEAVYAYAQASWVRPAEWLAMPAMTASDQRIAMLVAVKDNDMNVVWFQIGASAGCTIDWGDGVVESFGSGGTFGHKYQYSDADLTDTSATLGYKQALINVTIPSGDITSFQLGQYNPPTGLFASGYTYNISYDYAIDIKEIKCSLPNVSNGALYFGGAVAIIMAEKVTCLAYGGTSAASMFNNMPMLQIIDMNLSAITDYSSCFANCYSLKTVPQLNNTGLASYSSAFQNCYSLITIPAFHSASSLNSTFSGCRALEYVPTIVGRLTAASSIIFGSCSNLRKATIDITSVSNYANSSIFTGCSSLEEVTIVALDTTQHSSQFNACSSLKKVTGLTNNTKVVTSVGSLFSSCASIEIAPLLDTSNVTNNMTSMFAGCANLKTIPAYSTASCTSMLNFCNTAYSVTRILTPIKFTNSIANLKLSADALNELFTILPTVTGQTLTITGNPGTATCDTSIATAKGWSVVI
jgi:hypothetical protein